MTQDMLAELKKRYERERERRNQSTQLRDRESTNKR